MPREPIPFQVDDLSVFARSLARALAQRETTEPPKHVEMLQLLARAAGHRNYQSLRAARPKAKPATRAPAALAPHASRALRLFDEQGRLTQWPSRFAVQKLAMWVLWTRFDPRRVYDEKQVNAILKAAHTFGDHATLRRELVNHHLLTRTSDCSEYRRLPAHPDVEAESLLLAVRQRRRDAAPASSVRA